MNLFDLAYDRTMAVLIFNGKLYENECNHQYALYSALLDNNDCIENYVKEDYYDEEENFIERNLDELIEYTDSKSKENELFTFDIFDNKYLLAHYKSNLDLNYDLIREYADKNNLKLGYYDDFRKDKYDVELLRRE